MGLQGAGGKLASLCCCNWGCYLLVMPTQYSMWDEFGHGPHPYTNLRLCVVFVTYSTILLGTASCLWSEQHILQYTAVQTSALLQFQGIRIRKKLTHLHYKYIFFFLKYFWPKDSVDRAENYGKDWTGFTHGYCSQPYSEPHMGS